MKKAARLFLLCSSIFFSSYSLEAQTNKKDSVEEKGIHNQWQDSVNAKKRMNSQSPDLPIQNIKRTIPNDSILKNQKLKPAIDSTKKEMNNKKDSMNSENKKQGKDSGK